MADDLDELMRRAMKTLDAGVPTGYFEDLPGRALARLESSMDSTTQSSGEREQDTPPAAPIEPTLWLDGQPWSPSMAVKATSLTSSALMVRKAASTFL